MVRINVNLVLLAKSKMSPDNQTVFCVEAGNIPPLAHHIVTFARSAGTKPK
jgi:hypothetical protein